MATTYDVEGYRAWLMRTNRSQNTIRMYTSKIADLAGSGLIPTQWIYEARQNELSAAAVKMMLAAVRSYNKYAGISDRELDEFNSPTLPEPNPHPLPNGLIDVRLALEFTNNRAHKTAIVLGAMAGCRVSESISLTQSDIKEGRLHIHGKGDKYRRVPISEELKFHLSMVETEQLVPICNQSARKGIITTFKRAGITSKGGKSVSSHDLRATFATETYNKTKNLRTTQVLLGHSSISMTQRYLGVSDFDLEMAVEL